MKQLQITPNVRKFLAFSPSLSHVWTETHKNENFESNCSPKVVTRKAFEILLSLLHKAALNVWAVSAEAGKKNRLSGESDIRLATHGWYDLQFDYEPEISMRPC